MTVLDRLALRPADRPGLVLVCLGLVIGVAVLGAVVDADWLLVLAVPLVFVASRWGYGDSLERTAVRTGLVGAVLIVLALL